MHLRRFLLQRTVFKRRSGLLLQKVELHRRQTPEEIDALQLRRFNSVWYRCIRDIPFYERWARDHSLPAAITATSDVAAFPRLTKAVIIERAEEVFQNATASCYVTTGGSTGEPARYPAARSDFDDMWASMYLGRSWWGIEPFDRQVMLWGHGHLFGRGAGVRLAQLKRTAADHVVNIRRLNAYDMGDESLRSHYEAIQAADPVFVVGYTSAVFRLCRYIEAERLPLRLTRLRAVILTAETVTEPDVDQVRRTFGVPVVIEYGAAETGVVACSRRESGPLEVMWDSFICIADSVGRLLLTTITPRLFPLVNYEIGDVVGNGTPRGVSLLQVASIAGRAQDVLRFATVDGRRLTLSAILPVHVLKAYEGIRSVAFEQNERSVTVFVEAGEALDLTEVAAFFDRQMRKEHRDFDSSSVKFVRVAEQQKTLAGKHRLMRLPEATSANASVDGSIAGHTC